MLPPCLSSRYYQDGLHHEYTILPLGEAMRTHAYLREQSRQPPTFSSHQWLFDTLVFKSHLHPRFVIVSAGQHLNKAFGDAVAMHPLQTNRLLNLVRLYAAWTRELPASAYDDNSYILKTPDGSPSSEDDRKGTSHGRGSIARGGKKRRHVSKSPSTRSGKRLGTTNHLAKNMSGETLRELEDAEGGSAWAKEEIERWSAGVHRKKRKII